MISHCDPCPPARPWECPPADKELTLLSDASVCLSVFVSVLHTDAPFRLDRIPSIQPRRRTAANSSLQLQCRRRAFSQNQSNGESTHSFPEQNVTRVGTLGQWRDPGHQWDWNLLLDLGCCGYISRRGDVTVR
ncbi:hypothetical protein J6590_034415 [Homalodisca vitripennis]|nr:hypothetical protein J6590_034415 [Homalodisca vitripennis]